jgi:hypothetical protein
MAFPIPTPSCAKNISHNGASTAAPHARKQEKISIVNCVLAIHDLREYLSTNADAGTEKKRYGPSCANAMIATALALLVRS